MTIWRMRIACWVAKATHTLIICKTYCFSTATMVMRTRLNVALIQPLLVLLRDVFTQEHTKRDDDSYSAGPSSKLFPKMRYWWWSWISLVLSKLSTEVRSLNLLNTTTWPQRSFNICPSTLLISGLPAYSDYIASRTGVDNDYDFLVDISTLAAAAIPGRQHSERWVNPPVPNQR